MKKSILAMLFASLTLGLAAQTENPRGIYKLMTLVGKNGEVNSPFHQYKVCTDSLTLTVVFQRDDGIFQIQNQDRKVFNYTGEEPKSDDDKSILIYDSNAEHFSEKWWSDYRGHMFFPENDWCVEKYKSGEYTAESRACFDAMTGKAVTDAKNPLTGTWRMIGYVDELHNVKKELPGLYEEYPSSKYYNTFWEFSPKHWVMVTSKGGGTSNITFDGKKAFQLGNMSHQVKWLSKDCIAVSEHIDYRIDWVILERVTDGQTPMSYIISQYIQRAPRALN